MSSLIVANCISNLSKIGAANFGSRLYLSEDCVADCLRYQTPPLSSSSSSILRKGRTGDGRGCHLRSGDGRTSFAMVTGEPATPCDSCSGRGWLLCDFCEGQKVNVQGKNNRIYRRCPSCRTAGVVICPRCKVFKCVSFPDEKDAGIAL